MEENVGETDKLVRIVLGALLGTVSIAVLGGYLEVNELISPVLGVLSLALLTTAFTGKCGVYKALGKNTCKVD